MIRTGRRPGHQNTREAILAAARSAFAKRGFDRASIRQIAAKAEVDPALVHHYFGSKDKLFVASMIPFDPDTALPQLYAEGRENAGERAVRLFLRVWDSPAGNTAAALMRSGMTHDLSARLVKEFLTRQILHRAAKLLDLDPDEAPLRTSLAASQMMGLAMARYIIPLEPLASADPEILVAMIAPTIQRYLTGPLEPLLPTT